MYDIQFPGWYVLYLCIHDKGKGGTKIVYQIMYFLGQNYYLYIQSQRISVLESIGADILVISSFLTLEFKPYNHFYFRSNEQKEFIMFFL